jgi:hypothetical protein
MGRTCRITGAGGRPWVYGWVRRYAPASLSFGSTVNFYQSNNIYIADQTNNEFQVIDIKNPARNANINVSPKQRLVHHIGARMTYTEYSGVTIHTLLSRFLIVMSDHLHPDPEE